MIDVSVIVVSFNTRDLTLACLDSVFEQTSGIEWELIVVDNASTDGSPEAIAARFPDARVVALRENVGFARGNNVAAEHARGNYLLLLNPDTVVLDGAIQKLHAFAESRPDAGIFGGRTVFADGTLNATSCWGRPTPWSALSLAAGLAHFFPGSRLFDRESLGWWARDDVREVDIVTGCFLLIRRELWDRLGGFDAGFFMYGEEADLCLRARTIGVAGLLCPSARIVHYGGASERVRADKMVRLFVAKARLFRKHWGRGAARFGVATLDLWAGSRVLAFAALRLVGRRHQPALDTWRDVWRRRREWRAHPDDAASRGVPRAMVEPRAVRRANRPPMVGR
jgi:GT2 family glycosyltransferase